MIVERVERLGSAAMGKSPDTTILMSLILHLTHFTRYQLLMALGAMKEPDMPTGEVN